MNKKWVQGGDLSWHFLPRCDHSNTLPPGFEPVRAGDSYEP